MSDYSRRIIVTRQVRAVYAQVNTGWSKTDSRFSFNLRSV